MKIILATPIYPPELGGPAEYVKKLATELKARGFQIFTLSYGAGDSSEEIKFVKRSVFRHFIYFWKLFWLSGGADIVYAFDPLSTGLPAYLVAKLRGIKLVMRVGGDYLWERDVESGRAWTTLRGYYQSELWKKRKFTHWLLRKVFSGVNRFVFTTSFQAKIYTPVFGIPENKIVVIKNPFSSVGLTSVKAGSRDIIFAGRFIKLKNLDNLILAFKNIAADFKDYKLVLIGRGPEREHLHALVAEHNLSGRVMVRPSAGHKELLEEISKATACVLPSLSEVSPNFVLECISLGTPILLTRENGLDLEFKDEWLLDPLDIKDMENKLCLLIKNAETAPAIKIQMAGMDMEAVVKKHLEIFEILCAKER
jgi:glycosyltransferase involved in cell wall biosynthesis